MGGFSGSKKMRGSVAIGDFWTSAYQVIDDQGHYLANNSTAHVGAAKRRSSS
jgi:hypothetical protein